MLTSQVLVVVNGLISKLAARINEFLKLRSAIAKSICLLGSGSHHDVVINTPRTRNRAAALGVTIRVATLTC